MWCNMICTNLHDHVEVISLRKDNRTDNQHMRTEDMQTLEDCNNQRMLLMPPCMVMHYMANTVLTSY